MEGVDQQTTTTSPTNVDEQTTTPPPAIVDEQTTNAPPANDDPTDITNVAKRKRTKRQRPQSPIRFTFSSSNNNDVTYSPVSSSGFSAGSITAEEEDTAESLILLSKGQSLHMTNLWTPRKNNLQYDEIYKFSSKKYIQSSDNEAGGVYVYECKTCGRTFPSFQALGGHRASHKKPRNNEDLKKPLPYMAVMEPQEFIPKNDYSSLSFQLNNRMAKTIKSSSKLHECSICGTEFNSGQALGGHMRRHRVIGGKNKHSGSISGANTLSLTPFSPVAAMKVYDQKCENDALCLSLDLNLPAPRETVVAAASDKKQSFICAPTGENEGERQPAVHLSPTPPLVDCYY
ncbi:hypothetical protein QVD17_09047 [Tagetes erecta]|uniref:C2H2-type domain-containing protein n=1 Tax=Tagetes erecta TaxID=13708 RepID=A0AAD8KYM8_TARER|nr:hypothetical protein QVD17_09047 [Tagetes erecta]